MTTKYFVPAKGLTVIDPVTAQVVPPEGKRVHEHDEYYVRRVMDGDGEFTAEPAEPETEH